MEVRVIGFAFSEGVHIFSQCLNVSLSLPAVFVSALFFILEGEAFLLPLHKIGFFLYSFKLLALCEMDGREKG